MFTNWSLFGIFPRLETLSLKLFAIDNFTLNSSFLLPLYEKEDDASNSRFHENFYAVQKNHKSF